jgi:16S rRNA (cytosine967-C5)-methyltransferase
MNEPIEQERTPQQARVDQALTILNFARRAVETGKPADQLLRDAFKQNRQFGSRDRRFYGDLVFSYFRWAGWIDPLAAGSVQQSAALAVWLDAETTTPETALLAEHLPPALTQQGPLGALSVAAKAERLAAAFDTQPPDPLDLLPGWLPEIWPNDPAHPAAWPDIVEAFQHRPPTWLAVPPASVNDTLSALSGLGKRAEAHPVFAGAVAVYAPFHLPELLKKVPGIIIQDLASQAVGRLCQARSGEHWWDACAGSGGKTLHLAAGVGHKGHVFATDDRPGILKELRRRTQRRFADAVRIGRMDAKTRIPEEAPLDGVLLDAPCANIGTWHRNPDARWRTTVEDIAALAEGQSEMLRNSARAVKPGGVLVYAVCSMSHAETLGAVGKFLETHPQFTREPIPHPLHPDEAVEYCWIKPWEHDCNGMFAVRLKRTT